MKVDPVVKKETGTIAIGVCVLSLMMLAVFAFLQKLDYTVLLGTLLGIAAAVANFFLMALSVQKSAEKMRGVSLPPVEETEDGEEAETEKAALTPEGKEIKKFMQASYTARMLLIVVVAILAVNLPFIHPVACLLVLLFPRLVVFAVQFIRKKKEANAQ